MDMDSSSSASPPSEHSLSVLCSVPPSSRRVGVAGGYTSSSSSSGSSPSHFREDQQHRHHGVHTEVVDEETVGAFCEKRRRANGGSGIGSGVSAGGAGATPRAASGGASDASVIAGGARQQRQREKRRIADMAMEQRLLALSHENELLKSQLESRSAEDAAALLARPAALRLSASDAAAPALPAPSATPGSCNDGVTAHKLQLQKLYNASSILQASGGSRLLQPASASLAGAASSASASAAAAQHLPLLQICQLQAAIQQQLQDAAAHSLAAPDWPATAPLPPSLSAASATGLFSAGASAFQPFHKESVIKRAAAEQRISPDSSSDFFKQQAQQLELQTDAIRGRLTTPDPVSAAAVPCSSASNSTSVLVATGRPNEQPQRDRDTTASSQQRNRDTTATQQQGRSLLGAILSSSARNTSPAIPQTSTEHWSRLGSPAREHHALLLSSSSKSDSESHASSASLSPGASGEDHHSSASTSSSSSAIVQALNGNSVDSKRQAYMDRRRRNNEAAKRCRANRRAVFEYRSRRVQILEGENDQLKEEIAVLRREISHFKSLLESSSLQSVALSAITQTPPSGSP